MAATPPEPAPEDPEEAALAPAAPAIAAATVAPTNGPATFTVISTQSVVGYA
jgi:hypothetical protein